MTEFSILKGMTLTTINKEYCNEDTVELTFITNEGRTFNLYHNQDCCENVYLESIVGDLDNLIGSEILQAEEVQHYNENPEELPEESHMCEESFTWTFYKLATIKGYVTLRWLGESNGYYSEEVSFVEIAN